MKRTGSQAIWQALVDEGVEIVFGYPGGAIMPAYDALPGFPLRHVLVRHEQGAAHMADGYARAKRQTAVLLSHLGPGLTNAATGDTSAVYGPLFAAYVLAAVPIFLLFLFASKYYIAGLVSSGLKL